MFRNVNQSKYLSRTYTCFAVLLGFALISVSATVFAHGVDEGTKQIIADTLGVAVVPFFYIGAKHMVTGYDHLLFLVGVIFFLYKPKDILIYVTLFTIGHSVTLLTGVLNNIDVNAYLIDAVIGLSVLYKGFDNLGGFRQFLGRQPNTKIAVFVFGLFHGFGLATKLQELQLNDDGLVANLIAFNVGVEFGQFLALLVVFVCIDIWRRYDSFMKFSVATNTLLMSSGFILMGFQLTGYFLSRG